MTDGLPILDFVCPVCAAQPQENCELSNGAARFEPHVERKWMAGEKSGEQFLIELATDTPFDPISS
jgi:hypothetical protein